MKRLLGLFLILLAGCSMERSLADARAALHVPSDQQCASREEIVGLWQATRPMARPLVLDVSLDGTFALGESPAWHGRYQIDDERLWLRYDDGRVETGVYCVYAGRLYVGSRDEVLAQRE